MSADTVRQLTRAPVLSMGLPAMYRRLEPALNSRDPFVVREDVWWKSLRALGHEIGLLRPVTAARALPAEPGAVLPAPAKSRGFRGRRNRPAGDRENGDRGSISVEMVGALPAVIVIAVLVWQAVLYGLSLSWSAHAANVAARALSVHQDPGPEARSAVPASIAEDLTVSPETAVGTTVTVRLRVPLVAPGVASLPATITVTRTVVPEP